MLKILNIFKKTPKTYKVRIYNKHTDDDNYFLMGNHRVDKEMLDILMHAKIIQNDTRLTYSIDEIKVELSQGREDNEKVYVLKTSTVWHNGENKPSCYSKDLFIPKDEDYCDFPG